MSTRLPDSPPLRPIAVRRAEIAPGVAVGRALPTREQRMVGAWCFLDQMGPLTVPAQGLHVAAHPHTCLQTFTWMVEGELLHRDSLGTEQVLRPGQVNLMTAGHGIVHTEDSVVGTMRLHAAQLWIALPAAHASRAPTFQHHAELPRWQHQGAHMTVLAGSWQGHTAPTQVFSALLGLDLYWPAGGSLTLPLQPTFEHGVLVLDGTASLNGTAYTSARFGYASPGTPALHLRAEPGTRVLLLGGEPWPEPITLWWNFAGHDKAWVAQAQADWEAGNARFGAVPGATQRLPAPRLPW